MTYLTINTIINTDTLGDPMLQKALHIANSIQKAENGVSKINKDTSDGKYILDYNGMTGKKTRHLYNNICNYPGTKYLEIGTWNGSSSISAVYQNVLEGTFIDNWCLFNGDKTVFTNAMDRFISQESSYKLIENDCWKVDTSMLGTFNVYLYDGEHYEEDQFKALTYYYENMENEFVFLCDDWNWPEVRDGTFRAIQYLNLQVVFRHEIFMSPDDTLCMPEHKGKDTWWNGVGIFLLKKQSN